MGFGHHWTLTKWLEIMWKSVRKVALERHTVFNIFQCMSYPEHFTSNKSARTLVELRKYENRRKAKDGHFLPRRGLLLFVSIRIHGRQHWICMCQERKVSFKNMSFLLKSPVQIFRNTWVPCLSNHVSWQKFCDVPDQPGELWRIRKIRRENDKDFQPAPPPRLWKQAEKAKNPRRLEKECR